MIQVDGSIPASVKVPEGPALVKPQDILALKQTLLQNKLLSGQVAGKEAYGRAVQAAIDPTTGQPDTAKVGAAIGASRDMAFVAADAIDQQIKTYGAQVANHAAETGLDAARAKSLIEQNAPIEMALRPLVAGAASGKAPLTKDAALAAIHRDILPLVKTPETMKEVATVIGQIGDDPVANLKLLTDAGLRLNGTQEGLNMYLGSLTKTDTGPAIVTTQTPELGGATQTRAAMSKALSPSEGAEMIQLTDPNTGATYAVPKSTLLDPYGKPLQGGAGAVPASGAAPGLKNGRYPVPAASGGPAGAIGQTSLAPGSASTMEASSKVYQDDVAAVPSLQKIMTTFDQAREALTGAQTGKGSEVLQNLRGLADTYGIPINTKATDSYQEASKWMNSALTQESSRLGLNTDASRAIMAEAQPGTQTVKGAAMKMLPILQGLKAMDLAAPVIAQKEGIMPQQYSAWRSQWANSIDPLAFSANHTTKAEKAENWAKMKPAQRDKYVAGVQAAIDAGIYSKADLAK